MALLEVPATKSALLALRRQLDFAEEGYALMDRKRELLLLELANVRKRAAVAGLETAKTLGAAFSALRSAELSGGGAAVDRGAAGAPPAPAATVKERRLMGVVLPAASSQPAPESQAFGPAGVPQAAASARALFCRALPELAVLAGLQTSATRLAAELKRTQRRCNALSKKLIPDFRETILYLGGALEEREREYFVTLKMVRGRLRCARSGPRRVDGDGPGAEYGG